MKTCNLCGHYHHETEKCDLAYAIFDPRIKECRSFTQRKTPTLDHWILEAQP